MITIDILQVIDIQEHLYLLKRVYFNKYLTPEVTNGKNPLLYLSDLIEMQLVWDLNSKCMVLEFIWLCNHNIFPSFAQKKHQNW